MSSNRVRDFFLSAQTSTHATRKIGVEIETLFVDALTGEPISSEVSQSMMWSLVSEHGWSITAKPNGKLVGIAKDGFELVYELGWNNIELITPPRNLSEEANFSATIVAKLAEVEATAQQFGARTTGTHWDESTANTLMFPDERDRIWWELDGPVLPLLGHIASVHFNVDITSVEEGFHWIQILNRYYRSRGWPLPETKATWDLYLNDSLAQYEPDRYGPPPETFDAYCRRLDELKVVMNRHSDGSLSIARPALPLSEHPEVDLDLFSRSVWWNSRLRVRGGRLVLEIRAVPRSTNSNIQVELLELRTLLGF